MYDLVITEHNGWRCCDTFWLKAVGVIMLAGASIRLREKFWASAKTLPRDQLHSISALFENETKKCLTKTTSMRKAMHNQCPTKCLEDLWLNKADKTLCRSYSKKRWTLSKPTNHILVVHGYRHNYLTYTNVSNPNSLIYLK